MELKKKRFKLLISLLAIFLIALIFTAIIQTFVLQKAKNDLFNAGITNSQIKDKMDDKKEELEYKENPDYEDDYLEHEKGYGNEGDVIIDIKNNN